MINYVATLLREEVEADNIRLPANLTIQTVAYAMIRLADSFFYSDLAAGVPPSADDAVMLIGLVLPENP